MKIGIVSVVIVGLTAMGTLSGASLKSQQEHRQVSWGSANVNETLKR